ncbi:MAG TPA: class I adenylate-forming enzyme family protein [Xanthobacteraceae bacterium]|nr:class I adenylate-forming enzyme family protein [Xanthobacteraceae bacterium]
MIPGDTAPVSQHGSRISIDDLFRQIAARRPDALALVDAPNRRLFMDGEPRRLTFAQADRMVSAIAGRLSRMGLPIDTVVGIQLPNIVENILTILGVLRAGMIAAPMPLLWRNADAVAAMARSGAKALVTCSHVGNFEHCRLATRIAADVFSIRYVCGFGDDLSDGVVPLDDLFTVEKLDPIPLLNRDGNAAAHLAAVTFETGEDGPVPVARRHLELLAGGMCVLSESRFPPFGSVLSTIAPTSFGGISLTLVPWLLTGGALVLHHGFDAELFAAQRRDENCSVQILPAPVVFRFAETGLFNSENPATVAAEWRAPDRLAASLLWHRKDTSLVDVAVFGEAGLVAGRRSDDGRPLPIPCGPVFSPREGEGASVFADLRSSLLNTLSVRGPMVPHHHFPPRVERTDLPHFAIGKDGYVDTGYACRFDPVRQSLVVTGPPAGFITVGGYRFPLRKLLDTIAKIEPEATLTAVPDPLVGHRLVGIASDSAAMRTALSAYGINPLIAAAFADPGEHHAQQAAAG